MVALLAFAIVLLLAVFISGIAQRTVISTAVLFLLAGFIVGEGVLDLIQIGPDDPFITTFVRLALISVLYVDGMNIGLKDLVQVKELPGRALLLGMPLTLLILAVLGRGIAGLSWPEAFLVGAVLSPTDPVFASAIISREEVPARLRKLLNVESGLNDGLALPVVLTILSFIRPQPSEPIDWLIEVALGIVLGIAIPWAVLRLQHALHYSATHTYRPLMAFAIILLIYALGGIVHANLFLAAFAAGVTLATISPEIRDDFRELGEFVSELLKLGSLLIFGALLSIGFVVQSGLMDYLFMVLALLIARPLAFWVALMGSELSKREKAAAAWFGPRGFASVIYGLLVFRSGIPRAEHLGQLIALVIVGSIIAHSSTDVLVARWFGGLGEEGTGRQGDGGKRGAGGRERTRMSRNEAEKG